MLKTLKIICHCITLLGLVSCEEVVEWDFRENENKLVVDGIITTELKNHTVRLTKTSHLYNENGVPGVSGAEVRVYFDDNAYIFEESPDEEGLYISTVPFEGQPGKTYNLRIKLNEKIGEYEEFEATTTMASIGLVDSISLKKEADLFEEQIYSIGIYGVEPESTNFYLMKIFLNNELLTKEIDQFILLDDELIQGKELNNVAIYTSSEIQQGDTISLDAYGIEKEYYLYLSDLAASRTSGDPFGMSGPPSNVPGNISNGALGYFFAGSKNTFQTVATE